MGRWSLDLFASRAICNEVEKGLALNFRISIKFQRYFSGDLSSEVFNTLQVRYFRKATSFH